METVTCNVEKVELVSIFLQCHQRCHMQHHMVTQGTISSIDVVMMQRRMKNCIVCLCLNSV